MLKKLSDYEQHLLAMANSGIPLTAEQLLSVRTHIAFFQHERLVHELVMILFALLTVGSFLFLVACPDFAVLILAVLFLGLLVPYIRHYYGLENGVQRLYDLYDRLEQIDRQ
jgi:hypothetical protein